MCLAGTTINFGACLLDERRSALMAVLVGESSTGRRAACSRPFERASVTGRWRIRRMPKHFWY
jgi:hypothetical protein